MKRPPLPVIHYSIALSVVTLGDSLLYAILPSYYPHLGLAPFQVGILLSINRWVRLSTNHLAEYCYRRYPSDLWVVFAFLTGSIVTAAYGLSDLFIVLLAARILWGISFSFLRQAGIMTAVNAGEQERIGERIGYYHGINSSVRTVGIFLGGLCHDIAGFAATLIGAGILSLVTLPLGYLSQRGIHAFAPVHPAGVAAESGSGTGDRMGRFRLIACGFVMGVVGAGMIISSLGLVLKTRIGNSFEILGYPAGIATLTSFILGLRWFIDAMGSPLLGAATDRIGRQETARLLFPFNAVMLLAISMVESIFPLLLLLFMYFICATALGTLLSAQAGQNGTRSVASFATATDLGASLGPLIAWGILELGLPAANIFRVAAMLYGAGSIFALRAVDSARAGVPPQAAF
ncbi:MAG: MFS transporter [Desulfobacteraceae bacterium]|nr:MAG: MFS transporter [Desulfobacteraceae bacterium]